MNQIVRTPDGKFAPGTSGGTGRPKSQFSVADYEKVLRDNITPQRFWELTEKVIEHVERTGSVKGWCAIADRLLGKPAIQQESPGGEVSDTLMQLLMESRRQREATQEAHRAATAIVVIDAEVKAT